MKLLAFLLLLVVLGIAFKREPAAATSGPQMANRQVLGNSR